LEVIYLVFIIRLKILNFMRKISVIIVIILGMIYNSCRTKNCNDYKLDFTYSLKYSEDSSSVQVCYYNTSKDVPQDAEFRWYINGEDLQDYITGCPEFVKNGHFTITLTMINGEIQCSINKEFDINGIK